MTHVPISILPVLSTRGWRFFSRDHSAEFSLSGMNVLNVESGTAAIALALRHLCVDDASEVLVPAYNCLSMREPVWANGASDILYAVRPDLTVDLADIKSKLTTRSRAILVPHFFGFQQPMKDIKRLCRERNLALIEDCAHALFCYPNDDRIGTHGDYVIGSATKYYPVTEGGYLASNKSGLEPLLDMAHKSLFVDIKTLANSFEAAFQHGRLPALRSIFGVISRYARRPRSLDDDKSRQSTSSVSQELVYINPESFGRPMSRTTRVFSRFYSRKFAAEQRRSNYARICRSIVNLRRCRALFPVMDSTTIPYMVPVLIDDPEESFRKLKSNGLPMYRWEDCGESNCAVSRRYSRELIHLPCHEQLSEIDVKSIIELLRKYLH